MTNDAPYLIRKKQVRIKKTESELFISRLKTVADGMPLDVTYPWDLRAVEAKRELRYINWAFGCTPVQALAYEESKIACHHPIIMESWRIKGDKCNQELARTDNYHRRKPHVGGCQNWQQKIPYWEKRFVSSAGSLSWKKFLKTKEFTHLYDNIIKWDDSAAEAAFKIAKHQFYAKFHDLPSDAEPHNPDLYIDTIDWNTQVDHRLMQDLESEFINPDAADLHDPVVIFGDVLPDPYKNFSPYGWGDGDDTIREDPNGINWDDYIDHGRIIWDDCGVGGGNDWWYWNHNDNKAGYQGWHTGLNTNTYDKNNYYASYGNVNKERNKRCTLNGNNDQRNPFWRYKGDIKKSTGQTYGNRRGHRSSIEAHGSQRVCVHQ
ncbi:hypothetical protein E3N88_22307 [Mikania micrantha]|uniref:Uncharacterized protein n=1 Tax=Mikania micrantha TaxID=192012 RepID=A0A5N6N9Z8_9ASTR|nr:hypothetical protein E3N88_22307 [Mikania micrantha]